ncbi:MAG: hypothetical protein KME30_24540 [Iphinoe sp. HA4291-MV1]|jgi:hypothetical protein|nr:hypothetical protein [Iphinoe sp. HA4291-MV1]
MGIGHGELGIGNWELGTKELGTRKWESSIAHCPLPLAPCPLPLAHCPLPLISSPTWFTQSGYQNYSVRVRRVSSRQAYFGIVKQKQSKEEEQ